MNATGYWNNGVLEYWVGWNEICFYGVGRDQKKSDLYPLLIPNIPFFHPSKGGSSTFHFSMGYLTAKTTPLG
jgi:hypothetical protein